MYVPETHEFVQTIRGLAGPEGPYLATEGRNLRYAAMVRWVCRTSTRRTSDSCLRATTSATCWATWSRRLARTPTPAQSR